MEKKDNFDIENVNFDLLEGELLAQIKENSKEFEEEKIEQLFNVELEKLFADDVSKQIIGTMKNLGEDKRDVGVALAVKELVKLTKQGRIPEDHPLYINESYGKKIIEESTRMFAFMRDLAMGQNIMEHGRYDMQAYLNSRSIGKKGGQNKEATMANIKAKLQKINIIEALVLDQKINYTSNIKTPGELDAIIPDRKKTPFNKPEKEKAMRDADYNKIIEPIIDKLIQTPGRVADAEVAIILAGEFGLRPNSIQKINIGAITPKDGKIALENKDNKSKQFFCAKSSYESPDNILAQQILGGIVQRALIKNYNKLDADGNVPVITCRESNLHKEWDRIVKRSGVNMEQYDGKYKTLRHRYAQNLYNEIREIMENKYPEETKPQWQSKAIVELNYLMGHSRKDIKTTMGYVRNIW